MFKQILTYCFIAYLVTWAIAFRLAYLFSNNLLSQEQLNLYHALAAVGPAIAALITSFWFYGTRGLNQLMSKIRARIPGRKSLAFIFSPLLFFGTGLLVYRFATGGWYDFAVFTRTELYSPAATLGWILPLFTYAFFEEIGWRGFLLPHLQQRYSAWIATLILTAIWAFWHLPFFFYRFDFSPVISIGFVFGIFVGSIILTSIYNSNNGLLIPVMLFHFLNNLCSAFDKDLIVATLSIGFIFIAMYIVYAFGRRDLSPIKRTFINLSGVN